MSNNKSILFAALVLVAAVAGVRCKRANGAYCDDVRPCPSGFACADWGRCRGKFYRRGRWACAPAAAPLRACRG